MKNDHPDLYRRITDSQIFIQDTWYDFPKDPLIADFVEWYRRETGNVEYSMNKTHFRVVAYPFSNVVTKKPVVDNTEPLKAAPPIQDSVIIMNPNLPGYCARPDIVEKILAKENKKADRSKQIAAEEFRKQKEEFFSQKPKSVFDDF